MATLIEEIVFWSLVGLGAYVYVGFHLLLLLWSKVGGRPTAPDDSHTPTAALFISAYNEKEVIEAKIENALALDYPEDYLELFLVSDGSTDGTEAIARSFADRGLKALHFPERRGKNAAINDAVQESRTKILVFSDANALYDPQAVRRLTRNFSDADVGCAMGRLHFLSDDGLLVDGGLYWRLENRTKELQSRLRSVLVANDFQVPMQIGGQGFDILYEPEAVATEKSASDQGEEFARKVRIVMHGITGAAKFWKDMRGRRLWFFVSHKGLRWFAGYGQILAFGISAHLATHHWIYAVAAALQSGFYACALLGWLGQNRAWTPRAFNVSYYFCMVNAAALWASLRFALGGSVSRWEKAGSTR